MKAYWKYNLLALFGVFIISSCQEESQLLVHQLQGPALGTSYSIKFYSPSELNLQAQVDSVFRVINRSMSTYQTDSDISKINRGDSSLITDHMFQEVFLRARRVFELTEGVFDPTVGVLVDAWGFGPGTEIPMDSVRVDSLLQFVGFQKVSLLEDGRIAKQHPQIRFDFNAIAKGYSIDRLGVLLKAHGIENFLIEVGGELLARGKNVEKDKPWLVGIVDPEVEGGRTPKRTLDLQEMAMASSGNYLKFRIDPETGEKFVHTIDPRTGYTKNSNVLGTTVLAPDCATADAFATAFMAMELEQTKKLVQRLDSLELYVVYLDKNGKTQEYFSPGFFESTP